MSRMACSTSALCGRMTSSRSGQYATGVSSAATRRTGASRCSNSSPAMRAASSAPNPQVSWSSCAMTTRLVRATRRAMASQSYGQDRAQVEHRRADPVLLGLLCREERALHERAPRHHHDVFAVADQRALAERDHEVRARGRRPCCRSAGTGACARGTAPGRRTGWRCAAGRRRPPRSTGTRSGCRGSARRCSRRTGCGTVRRRAGSRRSARARPSGTRSCCPSGSAASPSRRASASSPARCSRRTGSRRPA